MKSLAQFVSLGAHRVRNGATAALLLAWGSGPACSANVARGLDSAGAPSTAGASGSGASTAGTSGSGTSGSGRGGSGFSGSSAGGSGSGGLSTGGSGSSGASAGSSGAIQVTAGASNGGAAGKAGGSSAGTGGSVGGVPFQCDGSTVGTPNVCSPIDPKDVCQLCIQAKCCTEYAACYATNPGNQCGWGGPAKINGMPNDGGEVTCIQACLIAAVNASGTAPEAADVTICANHCATSLSNGASKECGAIIGEQTSDLVGCLLNHCSTECFGG